MIALAAAVSLAEAVAQDGRRPAAPQPRGGGAPDGAVAHRDVAYVPGGHERQVLDLFVPSSGQGPFPLIIWIHGGGWQSGSKDGCPPLRNGYIQRGYAVASLNYRLSGHAVFPAQIEDCKAAVRWLRAHAANYNLDPGRFGAWGSSAGGHLVALLGTSGDVKAFDTGGHPDQSSRVQAVCDYYGPTDFELFVSTPGYESHATDTSPEAKLLGGAVKTKPDAARRASPVAYVTQDDPPVLIVHGDRDPVVPINQSQRLFEALTKAGVSVHFHTIRGAGHGQGFGGPEIDPMVAAFFERHLKSSAPPPARGDSKASESEASGPPSGDRPPEPRGDGRGVTFDALLQRLDRDGDGRISRDEFRGPPPLFDRLDTDRDGFVSREEHESAFHNRPEAPPARGEPPGRPPASTTTPAASTSGGLLFFAQYRHQDDTAPIANPHISGALFTIYWSEVESREGAFDWSAIDRRLAPWIEAGKKVALRIMWSSSGAWPDPAARRPTPQFVFDAGAVAVREAATGTDIPLFWDPVYVRHANRFLHEIARKFDGEPNVLFIDVTPGAETNPYRFRRIHAATPEFKRVFAEAAASDGRKYSHELWLETVTRAVDDAAGIFKATPLLVTLNVGSLDGPEQSIAIGDHCVSRGCYVGQNGLTGHSYEADSPRKAAFLRWSQTTGLYFEMLDASGDGTGSLLDVMKAAGRIGCDYLGVYAVDVLRGTRGQREFDPAHEAALAHGARVMGTAAAPAAALAAANERPTTVSPTGFTLDGEGWTYRDGGLSMNGILVKPDGEGPFPAVLVSHGLGGSANSFSLQKARELARRGFLCIAPDYTHSAQAEGGRSGAGGGPTGGRGGAHPPDFGASAENIRRARACVDLLRTMPTVDTRRVFAYGHSMGAFVTIGLAASDPGLLAAAAITAGGVATRDGFPAPSEAAAERIRTPFLIFHGSVDTVVRPEQSESLKAILDRNRVPNERIVFPGEGHGIDRTRETEIFDGMRAWFGCIEW